MNEDHDIEITPPHEGTSKPKRPVGFKTLGVGVILASLFGASGGAMLSKTLQAPAVNISPLTTKIEALDSENINLKAQVARLQKDIKTLSKPMAVNLKTFETRLGVLETMKQQEIDPELVARLEALKQGGSEALDLSDILARIEVLESGLVTVAPAANVSPSLSVVSLSEPFPEVAILAALKSTQPSGGWLKRSLKKHISVQSDDNPQYLVELIVQNIEKGNIEAALTAFDKLPPEAKAAGQQWYDALRIRTESQ